MEVRQRDSRVMVRFLLWLATFLVVLSPAAPACAQAPGERHIATELVAETDAPAAGSTVSIRVETPRDEQNGSQTRFEQTVAVPQFADLDKLSATHRHGMLSLTIPIKDSVKPRQIEIQAYDEQKQLTGSAS